MKPVLWIVAGIAAICASHSAFAQGTSSTCSALQDEAKQFLLTTGGRILGGTLDTSAARYANRLLEAQAAQDFTANTLRVIDALKCPVSPALTQAMLSQALSMQCAMEIISTPKHVPACERLKATGAATPSTPQATQ